MDHASPGAMRSALQPGLEEGEGHRETILTGAAWIRQATGM